jgi:hypothetical protein
MTHEDKFVGAILQHGENRIDLYAQSCESPSQLCYLLCGSDMSLTLTCKTGLLLTPSSKRK